MPEVLYHYMDKIDNSDALERLNLEEGKYILVSAHREENLDIEKNFKEVVNTLNTVAEEFKLPVIYSTHPRSWNKIEEKGVEFNPLITNLRPFGFFDYNKLQKKAYCVLSDSGTLSEESSILGFPAVLFRTSTERPEVLDKGSIVIGGIKPRGVVNAIRIARETFESGERAPLSPDYMDRNVSVKVLKIVQGYFDIINSVSWLKARDVND